MHEPFILIAVFVRPKSYHLSRPTYMSYPGTVGALASGYGPYCPCTPLSPRGYPSQVPLSSPVMVHLVLSFGQREVIWARERFDESDAFLLCFSWEQQSIFLSILPTLLAYPTPRLVFASSFIRDRSFRHVDYRQMYGGGAKR
ncbi:hypothetical protein DL93DRAFT_2090906 [Clavulina sp. PMI_390]|nr:hypothetical protein DL93DRAFT_2090906 [Clavulina sp. PMI_390]